MSTPTIRISHPTGIIDGSIKLDGSKSLSNRILIIRALSGKDFPIYGLSQSDDTRTLNKLLLSHNRTEYDAGHAGTTFRFLTAYLSLRRGTQILTGSKRMKQRPIGPLVDALRKIGCSIQYMDQEGYPPLKIGSPELNRGSDHIKIDAGISSQYITALLLIAPTLPRGLSLHFTGEMVSESYLYMTLGVLKDFGIVYRYEDGIVSIEPQSFTPRPYTIEVDWSAASYHYAIVALSQRASLVLSGLFENSFQGDAKMIELGKNIGVHTVYKDRMYHLSKSAAQSRLEYDFINQPDLAQTLAVVCGAKGIRTKFTGLRTLKIKETDRIWALDHELKKMGSSFTPLVPSTGKMHYQTSVIKPGKSRIPRFSTYNDHRMAMAFAPLALISPIEIENPDVVSKSYSHFWKDLKILGFEITRL